MIFFARNQFHSQVKRTKIIPASPAPTFINNLALLLQLTCMLRSAIYVPMTIIIVAKNPIPFYQRNTKCMNEQRPAFLLISFSLLLEFVQCALEEKKIMQIAKCCPECL